MGFLGSRAGKSRRGCGLLCSKKLLERRGFGLGEVLSCSRLYRLRSEG